MVASLMRRFNESYQARPLLTTMLTNAVLAGVADTVAQSISIFRDQQRRSTERPEYSLGVTPRSTSGTSTPDSLAGMLPNHSPFGHHRLSNPTVVESEKEFDFARLARFGIYGFMMAPLQFKWFGALSRVFPLRGAGMAGSGAALKRVVVDQAVFAPVGLGLFYTFMTLGERKSLGVLRDKLKEAYLPTLKANYVVWPAVQLINFSLVPLPLQLPFVSTIGIFWTAYLSLKNAAVEGKLERPEASR